MDLKELFLSYTNDLHHKKVANFFFEAKNGERWANTTLTEVVYEVRSVVDTSGKDILRKVESQFPNKMNFDWVHGTNQNSGSGTIGDSERRPCKGKSII